MILEMKKIIDFVAEVRLELSRVVWPSPKLTIKLTVIVIFITITVGFFIGGIDFILTKLLSLVINK